jgi:hypothetical protein
MKASFVLSLSLLSLAAGLAAANASQDDQAVVEKKVMVAVKTDNVDLQEMDISHLQPGDSETIFTESGRTVDLLRTEDDVEIYIDGEMLDVDAPQHGEHGNTHLVHERVEIICDEEENCEEMVWASRDDDDPISLDSVHEVEKVYIVKKKIETD